MKYFKKRTFRIIVCCLLAIGLYVAYSFERYVYPYDEVDLTIRGLPSKFSFVCLIAETHSGPMAMYWTGNNMLSGRLLLNPDRCIASSADLNVGHSFRRPVLWIDSKRIGILIKSTDAQWEATWFSSDKVKRKDHSLWFGRGSVAIDLSDAEETDSMSLERLKRLGMDYSLTHD